MKAGKLNGKISPGRVETTPVKTYERDGKRYCISPYSGREINMTDLTFATGILKRLMR